MIPANISKLQARWEQAEALVTQFNRALAAAVAEERSGASPGARSFLGQVEAPSLERVRSSILSAVVVAAGPAFGSSSRPVEIDYDHLRRACPAAEANFSPVGVWQHLESRFGSGRGRQIIRRKAAETIVRRFRIERGEEVKMVGGRVVLTFKTGSLDWRWENRRDRKDLLGDLLFVIEEEGLMEAETEQARDRLFAMIDRGEWLGLRERFELGPDIQIVAFKEKAELRITPRLAERVQAFLATNAEEAAA